MPDAGLLPSARHHDRSRHPTTARNARKDTTELSYHHIPVSEPALSTTLSLHSSPAATVIPIASHHSPGERDATDREVQTAKEDERPSLKARVSAVFRKSQHKTNDTKALGGGKQGTGKLASDSSPSSLIPKPPQNNVQYLPKSRARVGDAHRQSTRALPDCTFEAQPDKSDPMYHAGHKDDLNLRAQSVASQLNALSEQCRAASEFITSVNPLGLHANDKLASRGLSNQNVQPLSKRKSRFGLRDALHGTKQALSRIGPAPVEKAAVPNVSKPLPLNPPPQAPREVMLAGQEAQQRRKQPKAAVTMPEHLRKHLTTGDRAAWGLPAVEEEPAAQPSYLVNSPNPTAPEYLPRGLLGNARQSFRSGVTPRPLRAPRDYVSEPELRHARPPRLPLVAQPMPSAPVNHGQHPRPTMSRTTQTQRVTPPRPSALRIPTVPVYAHPTHPKHVRFHDAPHPHVVRSVTEPLLPPSPFYAQESTSGAGYAPRHAISSPYDDHSAVSPSVQHQPSIDHVLTSSSVRTQPSRGSFARGERGSPGEARRRLVTPHTRRPAAGGAVSAFSTKSVASRPSTAGLSGLSIQRTESAKYANHRPEPSTASTSSLRTCGVLPSITSVPNLRHRNGSIDSVDYGYLGGLSITNSLSLTTISAPRQKCETPVEEGARHDSGIDPPEATFPTVHETGCICRDCYQQRARQVYKSSRVHERFDALSSTCRYLERMDQDPPVRDFFDFCQQELERLKRTATNLADSPPPAPGSAMDGIPECEEGALFETLMSRIRKLEGDIAHIKASLDPRDDAQDVPQIGEARVATMERVTLPSRSRYRNISRVPTAAASGERSMGLERVLLRKGERKEENVAINF